jgi:hypothetical protein
MVFGDSRIVGPNDDEIRNVIDDGSVALGEAWLAAMQFLTV